MKKILIGAPVRQDSRILQIYLKSLSHLEHSELSIHYCFVDDNVTEKSKYLLKSFEKNQEHVQLIQDAAQEANEQYLKNEITHLWTHTLVNKVAIMKNEIIKYMLDKDFDYLFFVDSDLVLHPKTLEQLVHSDRDIISEIFWTQWDRHSIALPQVWLQDTYNFYSSAGKKINDYDKNKQAALFLNKLKTPGIYEVGGLGALTLIKRKVFEKGVNFSNISNISFPGEDRHFCIRATVNDFKLFVDTHYPAIHLYRNEEVEKYLNTPSPFES